MFTPNTGVAPSHSLITADSRRRSQTDSENRYVVMSPGSSYHQTASLSSRHENVCFMLVWACCQQETQQQIQEFILNLSVWVCVWSLIVTVVLQLCTFLIRLSLILVTIVTVTTVTIHRVAGTCAYVCGRKLSGWNTNCSSYLHYWVCVCLHARMCACVWEWLIIDPLAWSVALLPGRSLMKLCSVSNLRL